MEPVDRQGVLREAAGWGSRNSREMSRVFLHGRHATAAIMAASLAAVRTVRGRPAFLTAVSQPNVDATAVVETH